MIVFNELLQLIIKLGIKSFHCWKIVIFLIWKGQDLRSLCLDKKLKKITFVIGPETLGRWDSPEMEPLGLLSLGLDLNGVILWDTPEARVNCSLNSTFVRPLAKYTKIWLVISQQKNWKYILCMQILVLKTIYVPKTWKSNQSWWTKNKSNIFKWNQFMQKYDVKWRYDYF